MTMGLYPDVVWEEIADLYRNCNLTTVIHERNAQTLTEKISCLVDLIRAQDIYGCITGSCLLDADFDTWDQAPDVDVFVYSKAEFVRVCTMAEYQFGMDIGTGKERSAKQEKWKLSRLRSSDNKKNMPVMTAKFNLDGVVLNVSVKSQGNHIYSSIHEVLGSFDMSIIMRGYDVHKHFWLDLRFGNPKVAQPNVMRDMDCIMWNVAKWIRQFDRVVKYYARGYDTRPMAEFYLKMINNCIQAGCLFDSTASKSMFTEYSKEFLEQKTRISEWLEAHKED